jgi:transposase
MIDERMFELLRTQLALANEEKSKLMEQVINLTEEVHMLRSSQEESSSRLNDLQKAITKLTETVMSKNKRIEELERALTKSSSDLANAMIKIEDGRKKRFARTSEQRALLNNRNIDKRAEEKAIFNGTKDSLTECQDDNDDDENTKDKKNGLLHV